ncbi:MAG: response regulator [Synergistaceae bacterium]|jgi:signal transduction histidine kinase/DNA-binding NarL/FixJ family response regulator|nr:response regulator [Synergistaceae bacterium]
MTMKQALARVIKKYVMSEEMPFEARVWNLTAICAVAAIALATVVSCLLMPMTALDIALLVSLGLFITTVVGSYSKLKKYETGAVILFGAVGCVFMPALHFTSGGVDSGMTVYAVMVVVFTFLVIPGKKCAVMVILQLAVVCACLLVEYLHPEFVNHVLVTRKMVLTDYAQAIILVSVSIGTAIKFQFLFYAREKKKAEDASRTKSEFLATMSHEIRTPLNAIIGLSEIELQRELPGDTYPNMEKIYNSGVSLLNIINDILDISKIETGNLELTPVRYDTSTLLNDVVQLNIVRIGSRPIEFKLHIDPAIPSALHGDDMRVRQILNNLLSNAFKYTKRGRVTLRVGWKPDNGGATLVFIVSDTGIGIRMADMAKLFSKYTQLDAKANRQIEGTGLGLSITKRLVQMMGGVISVESVYNQGSTFTVKIPQTIVDESPIGEGAAKGLEAFKLTEGRGGKRIARAYMPYGKVLVVDDVPTNLDVTRGLLLPYGLKTDCVSSGPEAISLIRGGARYDLILMDHMMPVMDGMEAARVIREDIGSDYARTVPIVALTANAVSGSEEMFLSRGFNGFISKPIDIMALDAVLNRWVRDRQSEETLRQAADERPAQRGAGKPASVLSGLSAGGADIRAGIERFGDAGSYMKALQSYARYTPDLIEKLERVSRESLRDYAVTVHGIKGASYGIFANGVGDMAGALEAAAAEGRYEDVIEGNGPLIEEIERLITDLSPLTRQEPDAEKSLLASPDTALLQLALDACRRFDTAALEDVLAELESSDYENGGDIVGWLREQTDNLEYDAMAERLAELL